MNTLRELGEFVGLGEATPARADGQERLRKQISMRSVGSNLPVLSSSQRSSIRAMILALPGLLPISLEAESIGNTSGEVVFQPTIRVHPSNGLILSTVLNVFDSAGRHLPFPPEQELKVTPSGDFNSLGLGDPGVYTFKVTRTGIPNTGISVLEKAFQFRAIPKASPAPPPIPAVTCNAELFGDDPGFGGITNMRIFGGGFLPSETVEILENGVVATTTANAFGQYEVHVGFLTGHHTVHAHGVLSGRKSMDVGFNA
jgi:hypothetical protein